MRDDLPQFFLEELTRQGCTPVLYVIFTFPDDSTYAISDRVFQYSPDPADVTQNLVTSWGSLMGTGSADDAAAGMGLHVSSFSLSIANVFPYDFASKVTSVDPSSIVAELWFTFDYTDVFTAGGQQQAGRYTVQDNLSIDQASLTFSIDFVALSISINPIIGALDSSINDFFDVPIGEVPGVPGQLYGYNPLAKVKVSYNAGATVIQCDRDLESAGFPTSGSIEIGVDRIFYTGISGNNFTGCSSVGVDSGVGQFVTLFDHDYVFSFGAGPIQEAGPVRINGEVYSGPYTIDKDSNPVTVTFPARLPNHTETFGAEYNYGTEDVVITAIGLDLHPNVGIIGTEAIECRNITGQSFNWWNVVAAQKTSIGVSYPAGATLVRGYSEVKFGTGPFGRFSARLGGTLYTRNEGITQNTVIRRNFNGITDAGPAVNKVTFTSYRNSQLAHIVGWFDYFKVHLEWKELVQSAYQTRESYDTPQLDIGGEASDDVNPADALLQFIKRNDRLSVNDTSFDIARIWYDDNAYYLNGYLPGEMRVNEALIAICYQVRSVIIDRAGVLYLKVLEPISLNGIDPSDVFYSELSENVVKDSIRISWQRHDDTINSYSVRYNETPGVGFNKSFVLSDQQRVSVSGLLDDKLDLPLVTSPDMANDVGDFWLSETREPDLLVEFKTLLEGFKYEIGDVIAIATEFNGLGYFKGRIIQVIRTPGDPDSPDGLDITTLIISGKRNLTGGHGVTPHGSGPHGI